MLKIFKNNPKIINILSILFSLFLVISFSFIKHNSLVLVFGNIINFIISFIIFIILTLIISFLLNKLFKLLDSNKFYNDKLKNKKIVILFNKHPFIFSFIIMLLCWLPYIIAYYPAILSPDPSFQIRQFFEIPNKYSDYSILLDQSVLITAHHPVIHTLLLGGCVKLGLLFNSTNIGLFIYSLIQITILLSTLSFTIYYMKKIKLPSYFYLGVLLLYSITPVFPFYAMSCVKDVIFGCLIIIYIIMLYDFLVNKLNLKKLLLSILFITLMFLFRNNGIHVFILSFPFIIVLSKINRKKLLIIFISIILLYGSYSKIILPYFKITPTSVREVLSIPFQQTARYVSVYKDELSSEDINNIDKILGFEDLGSRYNPNISDPVKNKFNKYYTNEDLKNYFNTWFKGLIKHPDVYIESTINNTYGYFSPLANNWYFYHKYDKRLSESGFNYHYNDLSNTRDYLYYYGEVYKYIPILGLSVNIGFNTWLILIMLSYLIYIKKYKEIIILSPALILILVCVASPVNTYFRYALPYVFAMPLTIGLFLTIIKEKKNEKNSCTNTVL